MGKIRKDEDDDQPRDLIESLLSAGFYDEESEPEPSQPDEVSKKSLEMISSLFSELEEEVAADQEDEPEPEEFPDDAEVEDELKPPSESEPEPEAAGAVSDPRSLKKPKIDLAALRKAKAAKEKSSPTQAQAQASVNRLFGDAPSPASSDDDQEPPAKREPEFILRPEPSAGPIIATAFESIPVRRRNLKEFTDELTETMYALHPELLTALGLVGLFLAFNALVILTLALGGWI